MSDSRTGLPLNPRSPTENAEFLVFVDLDGNCFLQNDTNGVMEQHRGEVEFSAEVVALWRQTLQRQAAMLRDLSIDYVFIIAPDKQSLFWDRIGCGKPDIRNSLKIFDDKLEGVTFVDPIPKLLAERNQGDLYPLTDSHWDSQGAYVAYRSLNERLPSRYGIDPLIAGIDFHFEDRKISGDLGNKFSKPRLSVHKRLARIRMSSRVVFRGGVGDNGCLTIFQRQGLDGVGVFFADSFGPRLAEFLAEHFGVLIQIHGKHLDFEMIREVMPQIVISEGTERFMSSGPMLAEDQPSELLFISKIATERVSLQSARDQYIPLRTTTLPSSLLPLVRRHEALTQLVLSPETTVAEQRWFMGEMPINAKISDVLVAAFLAIRKLTPLHASWRTAYYSLSSSPRNYFEKLCGSLPPV